MILDLRYGREGNFHDLPVRDLDLYAGRREGLGGLHASHRPAHSPAIRRDDLHVVLAVQGLERCECFGDFHNKTSWMPIIIAFAWPKVYRGKGLQPENIIWRIEPVRVFFPGFKE
jgi:hypothetical protein